MAFLDVDAPDTSWRPGSEDPIPILLGRLPLTAFLYRFLTCRPLDGHSRTDATFWIPGTRPTTKSGRAMAYQFWPGWKRGLLMTRVPPFALLPWTAASLAHDWHRWWLHWEAPAALWLALLVYALLSAVRWIRARRDRRDFLRPIELAAVTVLRSRDRVKAVIPRGLLGAKDASARGALYVPPAWAAPDGDREHLLTIVRDRLGAQEMDANWNLEGRAPHMEIYVPAQPPALVSWSRMLERADPISPYLGDSATGAVKWSLGDDSPHMAIAGGSGSGKSELIAWIVAQFMRGGAGTVVLDPKYASHFWLLGVPGVLYCTEPAMVHATVLWLDEELRRRGRATQRGESGFPRIVVLLEERNSMQDTLRQYWAEVKPVGAMAKSPALSALDRLSSQGRSLDITLLLAAQETAQVHIGSRSNYGSFAIAGRLGANHWKNVMGTGSKKPAISAKPGRFGYVTGGQATVFQAAYPDLKKHSARLLEFALGGEPLLDVQALQQQADVAPFPSSESVTAPDRTEEYVSLAQFAEQSARTLTWLRSRSDRDPNFPQPVGRGLKNANLYRVIDLDTWLANREDAE